MAAIWLSPKTSPNAGMVPVLPFLMRSMMYSSLRSEFDSFGPLPAARPPAWWQKPHVLANICSPSMSFGEASTDAGGLAVPAAGDCATAAIDNHGQGMTTAATITNFIRIPASVQAGRGGRERSLPPPPLSFQRKDDQGAGVLRHGLEGLAIERGILVGHQAAPPRR